MMTARAQLLLHIAGLPDEDVRALLTVAERLRAKQPVPPVAAQAPPQPRQPLRHPHRFGGLAGSARILGDVESSVSDADPWTFDVANVDS